MKRCIHIVLGDNCEFAYFGDRADATEYFNMHVDSGNYPVRAQYDAGHPSEIDEGLRSMMLKVQEITRPKDKFEIVDMDGEIFTLLPVEPNPARPDYWTLSGEDEDDGNEGFCMLMNEAQMRKLSKLLLEAVGG